MNDLMFYFQNIFINKTYCDQQDNLFHYKQRHHQFDKILWFKSKVHTMLLINLKYCAESLIRFYKKKLLTKKCDQQDIS